MEPLFAIPAVMVLLAGLLWWLRRHGVAHWRGAPAGRRPRRTLELVERLPLTAQHSLHVVRIGGRELLIGVSPAGCTLLERGESQPDAPARGGIA